MTVLDRNFATAIPVQWSDAISLNGRMSAHTATVTRLIQDERFTPHEREKLEDARRLLMEVLMSVALRGA
jgi:hypothetical protein